MRLKLKQAAQSRILSFKKQKGDDYHGKHAQVTTSNAKGMPNQNDHDLQVHHGADNEEMDVKIGDDSCGMAGIIVMACVII